MQPPVAVLLVDPHPTMRAALHKALQSEDGVQVAVEARDLHGAIRLAGRQRNEVAIVDDGLVDGAQTRQAAFHMLVHQVPVVVIGMGDEATYAPHYRAAGASGYWPKHGELADLVRLLRTTARACSEGDLGCHGLPGR